MINCAICGNAMEPNGALLFSPPPFETPMPSSIVTKFHICRECYILRIEPVFWITSREPIVKQPDPAQARLQFEAETMTTTLPRPETPRERAGREMQEKWTAFHRARFQDLAPQAGLTCLTDDKALDEAWCDLREQYIPRPTISDDELAKILRKAWHDTTVLLDSDTYEQGYLAEARAVRKALTGEEMNNEPGD